jgi:proteasome lid subunit RPN8/RPN11
MLKIPRTAYVALRQHGEETYPHESCGVLMGRFEENGTKTVTGAARCVNMRADSPQNRYGIDPRELIRIQREGRERGEEVVGFYHSHPDHAPEYSITDLEEAHWIGCSYVITSVMAKRAEITRAFTLSGNVEEDKRFLDEEISVGDPRCIEKTD